MNTTSKKNATFCIMPWIHFHVSQNGNVIPCCQAPPQKVHRFGNINQQSIDDIWKGEEIAHFRNNMRKGIADQRCKQCYVKEEEGFKSLRQQTNEKYIEEIEKVKREPTDYLGTPKFFDIRFSNSCNLKCRICGPWASSKWHKDAIALGMRKKDSKALTLSIENEDEFFNELTPYLRTATEFYFAGGEPLMMEQHYKILELLLKVKNSKLNLYYNTNFAALQFKNYDVVEYWKQFTNVNVSASLDAEGQLGELLRKNLNWLNVVNNRERLMSEAPHVNFEIAPTVYAYNVEHLPSFHYNWVQNEFISVEEFNPNMLIHPKEYQINTLPLKRQLKIRKKYQAHIKWMLKQPAKEANRFQLTIKKFKSIVNALGNKENQQSRHQLISKTEQLDSLRNENLVALLANNENL